MLQLTQEELGEIIDITEQMCNLDGWVKEALPLAQKRQSIIETARSRPNTQAPELTAAKSLISIYRPNTSTTVPEAELRDMPTLHDKERYMQGYRAGQISVSDPCVSCSFVDVCSMSASEACKREMQKEHDTAIRNATLDELRKKYIEYTNHPCPQLAEKYNHGCDSEYCGICILDEVLESLRSNPQEQAP